MVVGILPWGPMQNKHWSEIGPGIRGNKYAFPDVADFNDPTNYLIPIGKGLSEAMKYRTKTPIIGIVYNETEQEKMTELHRTILDYVHESYARFVVGDMNIDRDWDAYVAEFDKMGLRDVIAATQSAWDRMNK